MVIGTSPVNEYDRRVVLLTKERGKITAFARGARRQYSAMLAGTQLFAFGTFRVIEGKNAYTLVSAEITNYFEAIPKEPLRACYASYFLEMAGYYARENNNEIELLKLLYQTLRILCRDSVPPALIRVIYELRIFVVNGEYPECFHCICCGAEEGLEHFSPAAYPLLPKGLTLQTKERRALPMYVTYSDLVQIGIFIVALVNLCYQIFRGKRK